MRTSLHSLFHNHSKSHIQNRDISIRRSSLAVDFDDGDSHFSYSNSNSPSQHSHDQDSYPGTNHQNKIDDLNDADDDSRKLSPKVQVIAASGDNIIAVANPALAMSPAIIAPLVDTRERNLEKE
ncbi:hypothetical protein TcasGA2_TC031559 [Tribolium castaneum]|uniref:Uncharacterized protein n=2 Tax=Tribolium castaneum TaxID=7070 RepID=A0A139WPL2_TRICA|nr:hypothetical protein TcasGA2_TC031559 [Tribolium castaneum]